MSEILVSEKWLYERLRAVRLVREEKLSIGTSPESSLQLKSRIWICVHCRTSTGKLLFSELLDRSMERIVRGQYFQKKVNDK